MYTFDHTLALCELILDMLACEHEPTVRWRRIPDCDEDTTTYQRNAFTVVEVRS